MKECAKSLLKLSEGKWIDLINFSNFEKLDFYVTFNKV